MSAISFAPTTGEKAEYFPPVFIQFCSALSGKKNATDFYLPVALPRLMAGIYLVVLPWGRGPECRHRVHILAFPGLSACQDSLNSSKFVVNEMFLTQPKRL